LSEQVHDFNGGIRPSGLFWSEQAPDHVLSVSADHTLAHLRVKDISVIDSFQIFGPNQVPATVSFDITWRATGNVHHLVPGSIDPTDPSNFAGDLYQATATGSFSGFETNFRFSSDPGATSDGVFAEMGTERNGSFLDS